MVHLSVRCFSAVTAKIRFFKIWCVADFGGIVFFALRLDRTLVYPMEKEGLPTKRSLHMRLHSQVES